MENSAKEEKATETQQTITTESAESSNKPGKSVTAVSTNSPLKIPLPVKLVKGIPPLSGTGQTNSDAKPQTHKISNLSSAMAIDLENHEFVDPEKKVCDPSQIVDWENSQAYNDLTGFIMAMSEEVKGKKLRDPCHTSQIVQGLLELLDSMDRWIEEFPPTDQPQRFGNVAYRDWFDKLDENAEDLLLGALGEKYKRAVPEIATYLIESVGNSTRIDYGTGHELSFVAFLCCLFKVGCLTQQDSTAVVFKVFNKYLMLMRKIQTVYRMEPAGSQGVWNLDDYHFIPFIWGSAQLIGHARLSPKSFPDLEICESYHEDYMFLGCIRYIHKVKTGPFYEHSNQLWNISGVKLWQKVNSGLVKMYKAEVLNKFPVIQHFLFGSLMSFNPVEAT